MVILGEVGFLFSNSASLFSEREGEAVTYKFTLLCIK